MANAACQGQISCITFSDTNLVSNVGGTVTQKNCFGNIWGLVPALVFICLAIATPSFAQTTSYPVSPGGQQCVQDGSVRGVFKTSSLAGYYEEVASATNFCGFDVYVEVCRPGTYNCTTIDVKPYTTSSLSMGTTNTEGPGGFDLEIRGERSNTSNVPGGATVSPSDSSPSNDTAGSSEDSGSTGDAASGTSLSPTSGGGGDNATPPDNSGGGDDNATLPDNSGGGEDDATPPDNSGGDTSGGDNSSGSGDDSGQ